MIPVDELLNLFHSFEPNSDRRCRTDLVLSLVDKPEAGNRHGVVPNDESQLGVFV
jgi:hypothetical protein